MPSWRGAQLKAQGQLYLITNYYFLGCFDILMDILFTETITIPFIEVTFPNQTEH
jgi:hypothetical protein